MAGEVEIINCKNGGILICHVQTGRYLTLQYNHLDHSHIVTFADVGAIAWKMAEFELFRPNNKNEFDNCFFIRSMATGFYLRIKDGQHEAIKIQVPSDCFADVKQQTKASLFYFEPRFVKSIKLL